MSVSGSSGDCRFALPPNPSTGRIRVGFTDCRGWSGTASAESVTSQPQPPGLLSSVVFGLPELVVPRGVPQTSIGLELLSVGSPAVGHSIGS